MRGHLIDKMVNLKRINWSILLLVSTISWCFGQNLVPNPSFENTGFGPHTIMYVNFNAPCLINANIGANPWRTPTCWGSPDFFTPFSTSNDTLSAPGSNGSPYNCMGYQPARTGWKYMGVSVYDEDMHNDREYIQAKLNQPLESGKEYHIEMYVSRGELTPWASNGMGMFLSVDRYVNDQKEYFQNLYATPQIREENVITESEGWYLISDTLIADSAYEYLTIGNFYDDTNPAFIRLYQSVINPHYSTSYYYIDDVSIRATGNAIDFNYVCDNSCAPITCTFQVLPDGIYPDSVWWVFGDTRKKTAGNIDTHDYNSPGIYTVSMAYRVDGKIYRIEKEIEVFGEESPVAAFNLPTNGPYQVEQSISFTNQTQSADGFYWDFGDGNLSMIENPDHTYEEPGYYEVQLIAQNQNGCSDTVIQRLEVVIPCTRPSEIPNVFSPNQDGINDQYDTRAFQWCEDFYIQIFDRWGKPVFESRNPLDQWTGGGFPEGVYFYAIQYEGGVIKGDLLLVR